MSCFKNSHLTNGPFMKKCLRRLGLALLITCAVILVTLEVISRGAAQIFNHAMANQDMLRGTITVERLISDMLGKNPERWLCYVLTNIKTTPKDKLYTLLPEFWEDEEQ